MGVFVVVAGLASCWSSTVESARSDSGGPLFGFCGAAGLNRGDIQEKGEDEVATVAVTVGEEEESWPEPASRTTTGVRATVFLW